MTMLSELFRNAEAIDTNGVRAECFADVRDEDPSDDGDTPLEIWAGEGFPDYDNFTLVFKDEDVTLDETGSCTVKDCDLHDDFVTLTFYLKEQA